MSTLLLANSAFAFLLKKFKFDINIIIIIFVSVFTNIIIIIFVRVFSIYCYRLTQTSYLRQYKN